MTIGDFSVILIVNVGGRPGDGFSGRKPPKERANRCCDALRDKFCAGVMPVAGEPISHYRGKQGLDGSKQRDRHRRFNKRLDSFQADIRQVKWRRPEWNGTSPKLPPIRGEAERRSLRAEFKRARL